MTSDRPYQPSMPVETALRELADNSGSQFDPLVVEAMLDLAGGGSLRSRTVVTLSS